jgi:hypothetical protein
MPKLRAIPSRLNRSFGPALVGSVAFAFATTALADPVWGKVGEAFSKAGTEMPGGVYRIALPRTDIKALRDNGIEVAAIHNHMAAPAVLPAFLGE